MEGIKVPYFKNLKTDYKEELIRELINSGTVIRINTINWPKFPHKPETIVYAGYDDKKLWLHFAVANDYIRIAARHDQDPVYQDSCVEFFIKVGGNYRNFEFNCMGTCLSAIGPDRYSRERLDSGNLSRIVRFPSLDPGNPPVDGVRSDWNLTVGIPLDLIDLKGGGKSVCNFYKCGDKTEIPHYVTWAPINVADPDYHRPEYFEEIELV